MKNLHEKLGITFQELGALLGTEAMLKEKIITHNRKIDSGYEMRTAAIGGRHVFNMASACVTNEECGSVACIGGTMAMIMGMDEDAADAYVHGYEYDENLGALFFPQTAPGGYVEGFAKITAKQALQAIANYKRTGKPNWRKVLA